MSPNHRPISRFQIHLSRIAAWSLTCLGMFCWDVNAMTDGEKAVANSPMPHERLAAGRESVKVHWVRVQGYMQGKDGPDALLNDLKERFQYCAQLAHAAGREPPTPHWPDYAQSIQSDIYEASNRTIRYDTTLIYGISPLNCSLTENKGAFATLSSVSGTCKINLDDKRADGPCDAKAFADAPPHGRFGPARAASNMTARANNAQVEAALAAGKKAMQQFGPVATGERKTIAGIECDVFALKAGVEATECISRGGSFSGWHAPTGATNAQLILETSWVGGIYNRAVKAQLDTQVNAAVFAPHLAGGFQVNNIARRK
jgi:hypothetical protein